MLFCVGEFPLLVSLIRTPWPVYGPSVPDRQAFNIGFTTLIMAWPEHVHIPAVGENIYSSYAATVRVGLLFS